MSLKHNLAANYAGQTWVGVMALAFLPLYVRYLGTEALGLLGVFILLQAWLALLDLGITPTLNREMARFTAGGHSAQSVADLLRSLEAVGAVLAVLIAVALWAASGYLAREWLQAQSLPVNVVRNALALMGLVVALRFCEGIYRGALLGLQRQVFYNSVSALLATARYAGAVVVLVFISPTIRAFYLWQATASIVTVVTLAVAVHKSLPETVRPPRVSRAALIGVRRFAGGIVVITVLTLLVSQVDKLLLSRLLSLEEFGYYTLASTMAGVLTMAAAPILTSVYPRLVELVTTGNDSGLAETYHDGAQLVAIVTAPSMLLLTLFPYGVVYAWSGDARLAERTAPLLMPLALGTFLNGLMWLPYQSQLAHGWTSLAIRANLVAVMMVVPAILWLVPHQGARAAAWIWVALNLAYVLIVIQFMHQRILRGEKRRWYVQDIAAPVGSAAIVGLLLTLSAPSPTTNRLIWMAFLVSVGLATAVTALLCAGGLRPRALALLRTLPNRIL